MKLHEFLLPGAALFCLLALLLLPEEGAQAARDALALCAQTVVPSLFPFFVLSALLTSGSASALFASLLSPLMRPLFSLSGAGASALALGLCGGYPVGARTAAALVENGSLSQEEGERLLAFCNNAGPGFLLGVCGAGVFSSARAGAALYLIHAAAAIFSGVLICRALPPVPYHKTRVQEGKRQRFSTVFPLAVQSALSGCLNVSAFVVFFTVLVRLLLHFLPPQFASSLLCSLLLGFLRHAVSPRLTRRLPRLRGDARLGRNERPLPDAQRAGGFSPHRALLLQGKGLAGAALGAVRPARAAVSLFLTLTAPSL